MARAQLVQLPPSSRRLRRPAHTWQVVTRPWQIQPICLAPVLPGETMKNMTFQSRIVTDPITNPLTGWWCEYYFFYVKHRDLDDRDTFVDMVLNMGTDVTGTDGYAAAAAAYYKRANSIAWARLCLKRVVEEYFRNEGEAWDVATLDGVPLAAVDDQNVLHSARLEAELDTIDINITDVGGTDSDIMASEIDASMRQWEFLRANNLTTMDYEQFLSTYGVRPQKTELHVPELLRYIREWSYPSNTVDPTTGAPSSAVSWAVAERADKDRFFREPGFIFGVSVVRPKTYRRNQRSTAVDLLDNAFSWLPAIMQDDPATSLKLVAGSAGPFGGVLTADHVVDVKDLFVHGDQFINFDPAAVTTANLVDLPLLNTTPTPDTITKRYVDGDDADGLFADTDPGTAVTIRQDGICQISILGMQVDTSPASGVRTL